MLRLVDKEWGREINDALRVDASELRIICPFINLADFAEGVSDITALRELLDVGADIRGGKELAC